MNAKAFRIAALAAALASTPLAGCERAPVASAAPSLGEVAAGVAQGEYRLTAQQLSDWVAAGNRALRLVDLRTHSEFDAGPIRGAEHMPLPEAVSRAGAERLGKGGVVVVYGEEASSGAQAAVLLRLAGIEAYSLDGGYRGWLAHVGQAAAPGARDPGEGKRLAAACRESAEWAQARTSGFVRVAEVAASAQAPAPPAPAARVCATSLAVTEGASASSPAATRRTASTSSAPLAVFNRYPLAPASMAPMIASSLS